MKKNVILVLFLVFILVLSAAFAESDLSKMEKAFDNVWVGNDYHLDVYTEEGGFVIEVAKQEDLINGAGFVWEYKANLTDNELRTVSALKWPATFQNGEVLEGERPVYDDGEAIFTLNEQGLLVWNDLKEHVADGLTFMPIGRFEGIWPGVHASAELMWADDHYTIYVDVPNEAGQVESYMYNGFYNREKNVLEALGTCDVITYVNNEETERVTGEESVEAVFSINKDYRLVWENHRPGGVPSFVFDNPYDVLDDSNG